MGELVIQYHDFENAKKEIKEFSEQTTTDLDLKRVDDSKGVGEFLGDWFFGRGIGLDHKVTGEELNDLTSQIQTHLHSINNTQIKLIKEFGQVYSALEALDKDYIQAILVSIKATEETSEGIQKTQEQIKKIVENQRKTLEELKKFKQNLDGYAHLGDIDKIWSDFQKWHLDMASLTKEISVATKQSKDNIKKIESLKATLISAEKKTEDLSAHFSQMIKRLESVTVFTSALEKITHLQDIDEMWESLATAHNSLKNIGSVIEVLQKDAVIHQEEINKILAFVEEVSSLEHLMEVDEIWKQAEDHQTRINRVEQEYKANTDKLNVLEQSDIKMCESIATNKNDISLLKEYKENLSRISHLNDVDNIWKDVEEHTAKLIECEKRDEEFTATIQKNIEYVNDNIEQVVQTTNASIEGLTKKIKYAYYIAGGSTVLAIIELILLLLR